MKRLEFSNLAVVLSSPFLLLRLDLFLCAKNWCIAVEINKIHNSLYNEN
jgi:hypothetical protein